ncbi:MAG: hypothetical protein AAFO07_29110 [Bacteroidota bacterium]
MSKVSIKEYYHQLSNEELEQRKSQLSYTYLSIAAPWLLLLGIYPFLSGYDGMLYILFFCMFIATNFSLFEDWRRRHKLIQEILASRNH